MMTYTHQMNIIVIRMIDTSKKSDLTLRSLFLISLYTNAATKNHTIMINWMTILAIEPPRKPSNEPMEE